MIGIGISPSLLGHKVGGYPLDSYSGFRVVFSIRRLLTSYTGDLIRLRRISDIAESDFGFDGNGDLDTAAITTWLSGADGFVVTWYDQRATAMMRRRLQMETSPNTSPVG